MAVLDVWTFDLTNFIATYTGGFTDGIPDTIHSVGEFNSAIGTYFDEPTNLKKGIPLQPLTTVQYQFGRFGNAKEAWYVNSQSLKSLYGGGIETTGWTRTASNRGIVLVEYTGTDPIAGDIGDAITHADGDAGVLLDFDATRNIMWIRPDSTAAGDDWDSAAGVITFTSSTATQSGASKTGESIWPNVYFLGNRPTNAEEWIFQVNDYPEVASPVLTKLGRWWTEDTDFSADPKGFSDTKVGHADVLVQTQENGHVIDDSRLVGRVSGYGFPYAHFEVNPAKAGRNVIPPPMQASADPNIQNGYRNNAATTTAGTLTVGEVVIGSTGGEGVVTAVNGTNPNQTFEYYLIGKDTLATGALIDFSGSLTADGDYTGTTGALTNVGPAADTSITATFGHVEADVDEDGTNEQYACAIGCNAQVFTEVNERLQFFCRRGETADIDSGTQSIIGEFYRGVGEIGFAYDAEGASGPPLEGEAVVKNGDATVTGIVTSVYDNGTSGYVILRQVRGVWADDDVCEAVALSTRSVTLHAAGSPLGIRTIPETIASPFGALAGTTFFFADGVLPTNLNSAEVSNYFTKSVQGVTITPPSKVPVTADGMSGSATAHYDGVGDRVIILRVDTPGQEDFDDDEFSLTAAAATENGIGDSNVEIDISIPSRVVGKTAGGYLMLIDDSEVGDGREQMFKFDSWAGQIFTLTAIPDAVHDGASSSTVLDDASATFITDGVEVGMFVYNSTDGGSWGFVESVDSESQLTLMRPLQGGTGDTFESGDTVTINKLGIDYGVADFCYVPLLFGLSPVNGTVSAELVYPGSPINAHYRIRFASTGASNIKPEKGVFTVGPNGGSVTARRDADDIT